MANIDKSPAIDELLCETCGYRLTGLPVDTNCPECGHPVTESSPASRGLPAWEDKSRPFWQRLAHTSTAVLLRPSRFYRGLVTRPAADRSVLFAVIWWGVSSLFFAAAVIEHARWSGYLPSFKATRVVLGMAAAVVIFVVTWLLNIVAARLSVLEGNYRGLRLTLPAVHRSLRFHSVHYVPAAMIAALTVRTFLFLISSNHISPGHGIYYLYVLCAEVVLGAGYLFATYWIAMRNTMYANA